MHFVFAMDIVPTPKGTLAFEGIDYDIRYRAFHVEPVGGWAQINSSSPTMIAVIIAPNNIPDVETTTVVASTCLINRVLIMVAFFPNLIEGQHERRRDLAMDQDRGDWSLVVVHLVRGGDVG